MLPEKPEFPSLLRKIENLAIQNEATISGIQFDPIILYGQPIQTAGSSSITVNIPETTPLFFSLTFTGPYSNLLKLLENLTALDRLITISSVNLTISGKTGGVSSLNIAITSQAYYYQLTL